MSDKKQILVSSLTEQIYSHTTKYYEFTLPSTAKGLDAANIQKQEIQIFEGKRSLKFNISLNLRLVYVEEETLVFREYELTFNSTVFEQRIWQEGCHYGTSLAPDSRIELCLLTPNLVAVQAKLHVVTKVLCKELIFIDELKFIDGEIHVCTTEEGRYAIPSVGTIRVSLEN